MYTDYIDKIFNIDCLQGLKQLPDESVDCCVTSPPYFNLRNYGVDGQIGLEETPQEYIDKLVDVFMEVHRVLKQDGTLWVNIGDTYNNSGGSHKPTHKNDSGFQGKLGERYGAKPTNVKGLKPKDLIGIPWMLAFALRDKGWYLRQDIIWSKGHAMPESVTDRCTKAHEYIFLLSKSKNYYFNYESISEPCKGEIQSKGKGRIETMKERHEKEESFYAGTNVTKSNTFRTTKWIQKSGMVRKRDVWEVNVKSDSVAHFATFPEKLITPCILAGCSVNGIVLDPFMGSGTTARVARSLNRHFVGFELVPEYCKISEIKKQVTGNLFEL